MDLMLIGEDALLDGLRMEREAMTPRDEQETKLKFLERMKATALLLGLTYDDRDHTFCGQVAGTFRVFDADNMRDISPTGYNREELMTTYAKRMEKVSNMELGWRGYQPPSRPYFNPDE